VLSNASYIRFSRESCVEVMCMKDIEQALAEKPERAATCTVKDPYGDDVECFVSFPGVTVAQLKALHDGKPLEYMKGPLMPYTAVVDPHTLEDLGGIQRGEATSAAGFIAVIEPHVKALKAKHGRGVDAKTWEFVAEAQVRADLLLGEGKLEEALGLLREMEKRTAREHETVLRKVEATRDVILEDAARRLDEIEAKGAGGRPEAARLAKLLEGTPLAERAAALARPGK
jgi:hypothetical protein